MWYSSACVPLNLTTSWSSNSSQVFRYRGVMGVKNTPSKTRVGRKKRRLDSSEKRKESIWVEEFHFPHFFDQPSEISVKCKTVMKMLERTIFYRYKLYSSGKSVCILHKNILNHFLLNPILSWKRQQKKMCSYSLFNSLPYVRFMFSSNTVVGELWNTNSFSFYSSSLCTILTAPTQSD